MSDAELVKRLLDFDKVTVGDARDAALRIEELIEARDTMGHLWAKEAAEKQVALGRIEALEQQVADLLSDVPCACGYDNPTDVCMKHLPLVRNLIEQLETARADTKKAVKALLLARVHVANNEQGWSVGRASARSDLKIINATLAEVEGEKT